VRGRALLAAQRPGFFFAFFAIRLSSLEVDWKPDTSM
jgi:hypothetical protein